MQIGAPTPDPIIKGQTVPRRQPYFGITVHNEKGDERGGFGCMPDGSVVLGMDDGGGERAALFTIPSMGTGLLINGPDHRQRVALGTFQPNQDPVLSLDAPEERMTLHFLIDRESEEASLKVFRDQEIVFQEQFED